MTCAVAVGWPGAVVEELTLRTTDEGGTLRFQQHAGGRRTRVVTAVDGSGFADVWIAAVERAQT